MKREANWPRYMKSKWLADGSVAYYWAPHERDRAAGFTLGPEPLGKDYAAAVSRAGLLNQHLDDWRDGKDVPQDCDGDRRVGTIDWWCTSSLPRIPSELWLLAPSKITERLLPESPTCLR